MQLNGIDIEYIFARYIFQYFYFIWTELRQIVLWINSRQNVM